MSSNAVFAGKTFRVDPTGVSGAFNIKTRATKTIGGRVVHIYGTRWDNLTITGSFGVGGETEQRAFLARMAAMADNQIEHAGAAVTFSWPERGWNFRVSLVSYDNPEGGKAIHRGAEVVNPKWQLTLFVIEDNGVLKEHATNGFLARLGSGLGWKQTDYNGPLIDGTGLYQLPGALAGSTKTPANKVNVK